ncbi:unnamed protein product [Gulo gulo]|uniref:Homeobox domain-containing protein n=1 Tax=Gulo gulo TaxID=48420 RepID=A0A9X9LSD3_GULGU|nr:unnamed protein product [Gulo gulo]
MSSAGDLPKGKHQKRSQRKGTTFTEKQLADLASSLSRNPYPSPQPSERNGLETGDHPTVLQVWFKNHRAKLRRPKQ